MPANAALVEVENLLGVAEGVGYINMAQHDDLLRCTKSTYWALVKLRKVNQEWAKNHA